MERKDERNAYAACSICGTPIRFYAPKIWYPDLASLPFRACSRSFVHLPPRTSRASSISVWAGEDLATCCSTTRGLQQVNARREMRELRRRALGLYAYIPAIALYRNTFASLANVSSTPARSVQQHP